MDVEHARHIVNVSGSCFDHVTPYGAGIWNEKHGETILRHSLFRLNVQLIIMFVISHSFHLFLKRFHFPRITSDILTGMIVGAGVFERYFKNESEIVFPVPNQVIVQLSKVGYIVFTFMAAVRMDPRLVKNTGMKACILAVVLAAIPRSMIQTMQITYDMDDRMPYSITTTNLINARIFFYTITNNWFVGVSTILMQQKITNSRLGHMALSSALLSELLKVVMDFGFNVYFFKKTISYRVAIQSTVLTAAVAVLIVIVLRALIFFFIKRTPEGKLVSYIFTSVVVVMTFVVSSLGDSTGTSYLLFPMILGLVAPAGSPLASSLVAKIDTIITGFLIPLLTIYTATKFDLRDFFASFATLLQFQITLIAYAVKLAATFLTLLCLKTPLKDAAALTVILNIKSVVEMGYLLSFSDVESEDISTTSLILLIFVLASVAPPLVKWLYNPEKQYIGHIKKSIEHAQPDAELRILACALRQDDAIAAVKLFEYSNPTKNGPLSIYGLCLDQLVGSDTPLLIDHQFHQKASSKVSHLQTALEIFRYLESRNKKSVEVHLFTAISPVPQMHEDICWLAFDRGVSLIVLPFHKKWNNRGKLVSSSDDFRNLNNSVLDRAPCSVGILIDRSKTSSLSSIFDISTAFHVGILFLEGPDDREALAYALRLAGSPKVELTVIHFTSPYENAKQDKWEMMLNSEAIRQMKLQRTANIHYLEKAVRDGSDTARIVRSIQASYDLIIVGRRHEAEPPALSGLSEWSELPELGPLGDMLASTTDISSEVSTLVIQQQIMKQSHSSILN